MVVAGTAIGRADGRIGSARTDRRPDARRRAVRPRGDADRDQGDQGSCRRGRQASLGSAGGCAKRSTGRALSANWSRPISAMLIAPPTSRSASEDQRIACACRRALAGGDAPQFSAGDVDASFGKLEKQIVRQRVLNGEPRIDGRDLRRVRPISIEVGILPQARTVRRCSRAVKRRRSSSPRSARCAMRRSSMRSKAVQRRLHAALQLPAVLDG